MDTWLRPGSSPGELGLEGGNRRVKRGDRGAPTAVLTEWGGGEGLDSA